MDIDKLIARRLAARSFSHSIGTWTFQLVVPTRGEFREAVDPQGSEVRTQRNLVVAAIRSWSGPTVGDLDPADEAAASPLPFDPKLAQELLSERTDLQDQLLIELMRRYNDRREAAEAAQGNSGGT